MHICYGNTVVYDKGVYFPALCQAYNITNMSVCSLGYRNVYVYMQMFAFVHHISCNHREILNISQATTDTTLYLAQGEP